ncbi:MAG: AMP phosphorylase [Candidatus Hydrothermarchaeales archaeon]
MEKKLKTKILDMEVGSLEVIINEEDAKDMGIYPKDRVRIYSDSKSVTAIVNTTKTFVRQGEIGAVREVVNACKLRAGRKVLIAPVERPRSVEHIRKKLQGQTLTETEFEYILKDVLAGNLSEAEISAFISAIYINELNMDEMVSLSKKMAETGEMLELKQKPIFDKHSLGGVPGNKITLLIVPIVAAAGLTIPKTSSRAITSACGTADIMEVLAPVTFDAKEIEKIVNKTNGIIAWGGGVNFAPADDIFIKTVEYPLSIDPHNLALCSVMAKKYAVGADFVAIDLPMGEGTKVPNMDVAKKFARNFIELGEKMKIRVECAVTYGDKPIGRAIGPALEAREALRALEGQGPSSLIEKSTDIAGILLEAGGVAQNGKEAALEYLNSGKALKKMREIIGEQGGDKEMKSDDIAIGGCKEEFYSPRRGYVTAIENRSIVNIARAAGSPKDKGAGILLHASKGHKVAKGDLLFEVYAESDYKLDQAVKLAKQYNPVVLEGMLLQRIPGFTVFEY